MRGNTLDAKHSRSQARCEAFRASPRLPATTKAGARGPVEGIPGFCRTSGAYVPSSGLESWSIWRSTPLRSQIATVPSQARSDVGGWSMDLWLPQGARGRSPPTTLD